MHESYDTYILSLMSRGYSESRILESYSLDEGEIADRAKAAYGKWKHKVKLFKDKVIAKIAKKKIPKPILKEFIRNYFHLVREKGKDPYRALSKLRDNKRFTIVLAALFSIITALEITTGTADPLMSLEVSHTVLDFLHLGLEQLAHYLDVSIPSFESMVL